MGWGEGNKTWWLGERNKTRWLGEGHKTWGGVREVKRGAGISWLRRRCQDRGKD